MNFLLISLTNKQMVGTYSLKWGAANHDQRQLLRLRHAEASP